MAFPSCPSQYLLSDSVPSQWQLNYEFSHSSRAVALSTISPHCPSPSPSASPLNVHIEQDIVAISHWHSADIEFKFDETLTVLPETMPQVSAAHDDTLMLAAMPQVAASIDVVASTSPRLPASPGATIAEPVTLDNDDTAYLSSISEPATLGVDTTLDMPGTGPQVSAHAPIVASTSPSLPASPGATIVEPATLDNNDNDYLLEGVSFCALEADSQQGNAADLGESSSALVGDVQLPPSPPAREDDELVSNN